MLLWWITTPGIGVHLGKPPTFLIPAGFLLTYTFYILVGFHTAAIRGRVFHINTDNHTATEDHDYKEDVAKFVMESKPTMSLKRNGDTFTMVYELRPGAAQTHVFKLGEYFEAKDDTMDPPLYHNKDICTWEADDTLKFVSTSLLTGENKVDTETNFKIVGENLHNLMNKLGDKSVIGNRVMVKVKDS